MQRTITLRYFAAFRETMGAEHSDYPLPDDVHTAAQLISVLIGTVPDAATILSDRARVHVAVNNVLAGPDSAITEGDVVDIFPPVSGG